MRCSRVNGRGFLFGLLGAILASQGRAEAPASHHFDQAIAVYQALDQTNPVPAGCVIFYGASNLRKWADLPWAFPGHEALNRGFGGAQMSDLTEYASRVVIPHHPAMVVIYAGDNDLAAGKSPERVAADLDAFAQTIHTALPETVIGCIAVKASPVRAKLVPKVIATDHLISEYCASHPKMVYLDVFTPMIGPGDRPRPELFGPDGLHLNARGYAIWKSVIGPALDRFDPGTAK